MNGRTWCEIDLEALKHNFNVIKEETEVPVLVGVKADAYGHGAIKISQTLQEEGASYFGVASLEEAMELKENGIKKPILLLSPVSPSAAKDAINNDIYINLADEEHLQIVNEVCKNTHKKAKVHVEIDTGMHRTGIRQELADDFIRKIIEYPYIELKGIFSHFPSADIDKELTEKQIMWFTDFRNRWKPYYPEIIFHLANSAGIIGYSSSYMDMVRPGITLYGLYPHISLKGKLPLIPVMSFKTRVVQIKEVRKGEGISYTHSFHAPKDMTVAVIAAGYADGYSWKLSNKGEVLIKGEKCKVVGNVCMDLTMVDISALDNVQVGDEVVLFGKQGDKTISVDELAQIEGVINYEILTGIRPRVIRIYK